MTLDRIAETLGTVALLGVLFAGGVFGFYLLAPVLSPDPMGRAFDAVGVLWHRVGFTFPVLALYALYLTALPVWLVVDRLGGPALPFDPRRALQYVELTAPLLGLLATTLAMGAAMQGFDPSHGMLSTSRYLVQHAGQAMTATAAGIGEAFVARTIVWVFRLDDERNAA